MTTHHHSFATVVMQALGGKPKTPSGRDPNARDVTAGAANVDEAVLAINRMLSF